MMVIGFLMNMRTIMFISLPLLNCLEIDYV
jgi:hypothetical protein